MTREEQTTSAYKDYLNNGGMLQSNPWFAFKAGVEWADQHPKSPWVNAKNELPTKGGHYLCMDENHYISALAFDGDKWVNTRTFSDVSLEVVKCWMPIPNLQKGGNK